MAITGQLQLGVVQVTSSASGEVIGYAFTEALERGQMQRWLLFKDPEDAFAIAPPPEDMARWTLADWQSKLESLWRPGSFYVWAQSDVYEYGGVYDKQAWTAIPPADSLPKARYPAVPGQDFQLTPPKELNVLELAWADDRPRGLLFTMNGLHDKANAEYWLLPAGYQPAGANGRAAIRVGDATAPTLEKYVDLANQRWTQGSVLVITGCVNYSGDRAPIYADAGAKAQ